MSDSTVSPGAVNGGPNGSGAARNPLLDTLQERASRPIDRAQAMPGAFYTDPEIYELEKEHIFRADWVYIGRQEQIPNAGDWLSAMIGGEPVMLIRGTDGRLRAFSRVCPHRYADVLAEAEGDHGHCDAIVCPYHSWSFDMEGKLAGAPLMGESKLFAEEKDQYRLPEYKVETWHGFVFVSLNPDVAPLAERMAEAEALVAPYDLENFQYMGRVEWPETEANWKLVMDNGRECYHHQGLHRVTLEHLFPARLVEFEAIDSKFWFAQRLYVSEESAVGEEDGHLQQPMAFPPIEGLDAHQRSFTLLMGIYPNMFFAPGPDNLSFGRWLPTGPTTHVFEMGYAIHKDVVGKPGVDETLAEIHQWFHDIQTEDSLIVTSIQQMASSPNAAPGAALSHLERPVWQFQRYLSHRLAEATGNA